MHANAQRDPKLRIHPNAPKHFYICDPNLRIHPNAPNITFQYLSPGAMNGNKNKKVVLIGGGVGSSTFTKALKDMPVELSTVVSVFDDGGSTGALRRDYGGIALGDIRQCFLASMEIDDKMLNALNYRFGRGSLYGINVGNLLLKSFLSQFPIERQGVVRLHKVLNIKNRILPVSYTFAKLRARLANGTWLESQDQIANYYNFLRAPIKALALSRKAKLNPDARKAILKADYLIFAPGNFFTSLLPHLYVDGFPEAWRKSKGHKMWFVNLLAHKGQDSYYSLRDYLAWFERRLGKKPFHSLVLNTRVPSKILRSLADRFEALKVLPEEIKYLRRQGVTCFKADLVSPVIRKQQANDTVLRAPLRHDVRKIRKFFRKFFDV
jgi:uncharacterized cofD-like protein